MIHFEYGSDLHALPQLAATMFRDRAFQFSVRLGWDVNVNRNGEERDQYDALNPLYVMVEGPSGNHEGSMRFLPTVGRTMVSEHFLELIDGVKISSPHIWECTRFCISPDSNFRTAALLMAAGAKLMRENSLNHFVAVFDQRMERVYRLIGASPTVLGRSTLSGETIAVGLWEFDENSYEKLLQKAGMPAETMDHYYARAYCRYEHLALAG